MTSGSDADRQKAKYKIPGRYKKPADQSTTLTPDKPSRIIFVNEIETGSIKSLSKQRIIAVTIIRLVILPSKLSIAVI